SVTLEQRPAVVELLHLHLAGLADGETQLAERAFVEVLLDDLEARSAGLEDVHGTDLGELPGRRAVAGERRIDLDRDEERHATHSPRRASCSRTSFGMSSIFSATAIPAARSRSIFSAVVSALPSTIVPAWPNRMPGIASMKRPAMNATIGRRDLF